MNFILPHSFELDLPGVPLLSTLELLLFGYSNRCIRVVLIIRDHLRRIYLNCQGIYSTDCSVFALLMLKTGSFFSFFIRGTHPVCGEPLFCFSANPDSLSELCGFHIDHRSRSFLLQVSGVSSRLSFCCTSLVSGFIIHGSGRFVYSQSTQVLTESFAKMTIKLFQLHNSFRELPTCLPGHNFRRAAAAGGAVPLARAGFRAVFCCIGTV